MHHHPDYLPDPYPQVTINEPFRLSLTPPGSKSLTNRALVLAALARGTTIIHRPLQADDTEVMLAGITQLLGDDAITIQHDDDGQDTPSRWESIAVQGGAGELQPIANTTIMLNNSGTSTRFLTAACAIASRTPIIIDGDDRMRERPIAELVNDVRALGSSVEYLGVEGCVPLRIEPSKAKSAGGTLDIGETSSSQFITALLQIGPLCEQGLTINLTGRTRSPSYIAMTLGLMHQFGALVEADPDLTSISVQPSEYTGLEMLIEPDASSATYFLAAAAILSGAVTTIEGLGKASLQGDVGFADLLQQMGAGLAFGSDFLTVTGPTAPAVNSTDDEPNSDPPMPPLMAIDIDMNHMPDAAMTLAVLALFAQGETVIRGIGNLRHKETDRLAALQTELEKFGAIVEIEDDEILIIQPPKYEDLMQNESPIVIETYCDHRMAMAFAIAGLRVPNVLIRDPGCVNKTYPTFWCDWARIHQSVI